MLSVLTGEQIRAQRKALGWSQEELAARAGVARRTVWNAELGTHKTLPVVEAALALALALGMAAEQEHRVDGEGDCTGAHPPDGGAVSDVDEAA